MTLSLDINKFITKTTKNAEAKVRVICLDLLTGIVLKTPVDTGRARANWQATINTPASGTKQFSGDKGSAISAPSRSAASNKAIGEAQAAIKQAPGNILWITNNLPYITALEYGLYKNGPKTVGGYSKQAPSGMVRITIDDMTRRLR